MEVYWKLIAGVWEKYTRVKGGELFKWPGSGGNHYPTHERLVAEGWRLEIPKDFDPATQRLLLDDFDIVDDEHVARKAVALSPDEAAEWLGAERNRRLSLMIGALQGHLDQAAIDHGYDNIVNACGYAAAPNPFQEESIAFVSWRGNVWAHAYQTLADVNAGDRAEPTIAEMLAEIPEFNPEGA